MDNKQAHKNALRRELRKLARQLRALEEDLPSGHGERSALQVIDEADDETNPDSAEEAYDIVERSESYAEALERANERLAELFDEADVPPIRSSSDVYRLIDWVVVE